MDPSSRRAFLVHYAHRLNALVDHVLDLVQSIPGSRMAVRYIRSSYQNDPVRSIIELGLVIFCLVYVLKGRFSTDNKPEVKLSEKEIDELVEEWQPEGLVSDLDEIEAWEIAKGEGDTKVVITG
jgi:serine palmitoyltransferase